MKKKQKKKSWPQLGDVYYVFNTNGHPYLNTVTEGLLNSKIFPAIQKSIFRTKKECVKGMKREVSVAKMANWLKEQNRGWTPPWGQQECGMRMIITHPGAQIAIIPVIDQDLPDWKCAKTHTILNDMVKKFGNKKCKQFITF